MPYDIEMSESIEARVSQVLDDVRSQPERDAVTGRFVLGTPASATTFATSGAFWASVAGLKADIVSQVRRDHGDALAETRAGLIDSYAEVRILRSSLFTQIEATGGAITSKGKQRAIVSTYLATVAREQQLAQAIGLDIHAKQVPDLARAFQESGR